MNVACGGIFHESNTFCPTPTDERMFDTRHRLTGDAIRATFIDAHHEVGGFLATAPEAGLEVTPTLVAGANPAGVVPAETLEVLLADLLDRLEAAAPEGVYLSLHGAMVAGNAPDAEGEILARVRDRLGDLPIVVTLDWHANVSERMAELADALIVYQTYPHLDQRQKGAEAARLLGRIVRGEVAPVQALVRPPLILNLKAQETGREPMRPVLALAESILARDGILSVSVVGGFPYADIEAMGTTAIVVADGDRELAESCAAELEQALWDIREKSLLDWPTADQAIAAAKRAEKLPVVLLDFGDNVGGGSSAEGTALLREILRQEADGGVVTIWSPASVEQCLAAGIGATVDLTVGGTIDDGQGPPIEVSGRIRGLFDGKYEEPEPRHGGAKYHDQGRSAVVEIPGPNLLVVTEYRASPNSLYQLQSLGIDPRRQRIVVAKGAIAPRAAYESIAGELVEVDTPGFTAADPTRFEYQHRRRPMFPFERDTALR